MLIRNFLTAHSSDIEQKSLVPHLDQQHSSRLVSKHFCFVFVAGEHRTVVVLVQKS